MHLVVAFIDHVLAMKPQHICENQPETLVVIPHLAQRHKYQFVLEEIKFGQNSLAG
jgi:hypothetical protein